MIWAITLLTGGHGSGARGNGARLCTTFPTKGLSAPQPPLDEPPQDYRAPIGYSHSAAWDDLVAILEPCDLRSGEAADCW